MNDAYLQLLLKILKAIAKNKNNPKAVYRLLEENSDKLDQTFILTLQEWATQQLQKADPDQSYKIASNLYLFNEIIYGFPLGNRALNIEIAITCLKLALTVWTRESDAPNWAIIQNSLGVNYSNRILGETAENIENAIACYRKALSVYTPRTFPQEWARAQMNLGNAYLKRIQGEKAENIETAIACYRNSSEVFQPQAFPLDCLKAGRSLGNSGYDTEQWETAIQGYGAAIEAVEQLCEWVSSPRRRQ